MNYDNVAVEVLKRIDKAVDVAGDGAKYVWPKLVTYTQWVAISQLFLGAVLIVVSALLARYGQQSLKDADDEVPFICLIVTAGAVAVMMCAAAVIEGPRLIASIISPEASIIMKAIGGGK